MAVKINKPNYKPTFKVSQILTKLDVHLNSGAIQTYRNVTIKSDDEYFLKFAYISIIDDQIHQMVYHKFAVAGFSWR